MKLPSLVCAYCGLKVQRPHRACQRRLKPGQPLVQYVKIVAADEWKQLLR